MHGVVVGARRRGWAGAWLWLCVVAGLWGWGVPGSGFQPVSAAAAPQQAGVVRPACRGLHRVEVDWWVMLKHPRGYQYSYLDSSSTAGSCSRGACWRHGLSMQTPNPVSHTLEVLAPAAAAAAAGDTFGFAIYNDADPGGTEHFEFAHAKGVVAFSNADPAAGSSSNSSSSSAAGFWLVHSAPRYPQLPGQPGWMQLQHAQSVFGQHFSCFSLAGNSSITAVADLLLAAGPYVYSSRLPASLAAQFPSWALLLGGASVHAPVAVNASLLSTAGQQLAAFAKSSLLNVSLTDAVVGPGLGVGMFWETWRRSHDALTSHCPGGASGQQAGAQPSSLNVAQVAFQGTQYSWDWSQDHSKWGVSSAGGSPGAAGALLAVCLGDMNRAAWQAHRGGSFVCMQHRGLWEAFHSILAAAEPCMWHA